MPAPVIYAVTSVLVFRQGQYFEFQPAASNSPTSWFAVGLPYGLSIDLDTGLIAGSSLGIGVYDITLTATNSSGTSEEFFFPIVLVEAADAMDEAIDVDIDQVTGLVSTAAGSGDVADGVAPVFAKIGDKLLLSIGFKKGEVLQTLEMESIKFALKEFESERVLVLNDGNSRLSATGLRYLILVDFAKTSALKAVLSSYENARATEFDAIAEIQWTWNRLGIVDNDPITLNRSTKNFKVRVSRDMIAES